MNVEKEQQEETREKTEAERKRAWLNHCQGPREEEDLGIERIVSNERERP
jgi:hypothetical protein